MRVDPKANEVIVGPKEALARDIITIHDCNWLMPQNVILSEREGSQGIPISIKLRSVSPVSPAKLYLKDDGTAEIHLNAAQYGIAPGQAAVCYDGSRVLGGGWIIRSDNSQMPLDVSNAA